MGLKDRLRNWLLADVNDLPVSSLPKARVSIPDIRTSYTDLKKSLDFVKPDFEYEYIPVIRKLLRTNSSVSLAATSIVELANPGLTIEFSKEVDEEKAIKLRKLIHSKSKDWGFGTAGLHGLTNKLILQTYIGGAMAVEWVLNNDLSGVKYLAFVDPETVRTAWNNSKKVYEFYQNPAYNYQHIIKGKKKDPQPYIKMNPYTFQYLALINDQEAPIGIPPFLSAIDDLKTQIQMLKNIGYVSDQMGLMGFLEVLMRKPHIAEGESPDTYKSRMDALLLEAKNNIKDGLKDGIAAGFIDDHEFNFHNPSKDAAGAAEIFDINHRMVSNGLFSSPQFLGGGNSGAETMVSIVFTKMLSQLTNIQRHVEIILSKGIMFELMLSGNPVDEVKVKFKPSTITDDLKLQQAREIRQRVNRIGYSDGIYSLPQYARDMGEEGPDQKEPRNPIDPDKVTAAQQAKEKDNAQDNAGDRGKRDQKKAQPKRKDQDTRKRGN